MYVDNGGSHPYGFMLGTAGTGPITLLTAGAERMRITGAGDVGIGTTSPGYRLDVAGGDLNVRSTYYYRYNSQPILWAQTSLYSVYVGDAAGNASATGGAGGG